MKKQFRGLLTIGVLTILILAGGSVSGWANHDWNGYHWATTATPLPLKVVDSVNGDWQMEFETALGGWNVASVLDIRVGSIDDSDRTRKRCQMQAGQIRICNATYGFNGWLGLATIGLDPNGHIDQGSAKMNDSYSSYWNDPNNGQDEKQHVMCQEIGHVFGMGHTSEDGSSQKTCMDYSSDPMSIAPNQHDYDLLATKYAHLESYNSYDNGSSGGGDTGGGKPCNPKKPGCNGFDLPDNVPAGAVRMHRGPYEETWVKGRPDGGLWIFHVRLAPEGHSHK